jgi:hypothetical protein
MKHVRRIAIVLPLVVLALGCERKGGRVAGPEPPRSPEVTEARWVWGDELGTAIQMAVASPLVSRAIEEAPNPRVTARWDLAVRSVSTMSDGSRVIVTMLPYIVDQDPTHALFISYLEAGGRQLAEPSELILGREPTVLETGFRPVSIGDRIGWLKTGFQYKATASGIIRLSPEKRDWVKFADCFFDRAPQYCSAGAQIASAVAPAAPYASAVGCGVGVAAAAGACGWLYLR